MAHHEKKPLAPHHPGCTLLLGRIRRAAAMDGRQVARLNIEYLQKKLAVETDETKRAMLRKLLAEEEAKAQVTLPCDDQKIEPR
jgi:hypothetical protein